MNARNVIKFNIKGRNARPDTIGMSELGNLLKLIDGAIRATVPVVDRIAHAAEKAPLVSLVMLQEGKSSDMGMSVLDYGVPAVSNITEAIASESYSNMPPESHDLIYRIYRWVSNKKFQFEIEENATLNIRHAVISRQHPVPPPLSPAFTVSGVTTAWGLLMRAGGKKPRAALLFPDEQKITISADAIVTKQLGERLYENVGIEGIATWRVRDWKMVAFKAIRVLEYRPQETDIVRIFRELSEASGGRWEGIDPEEYVRELRGYLPAPDSEDQR